jgi:hypothetical protein
MLCDRSGNDSVLGATTRKISEASHRPPCVRAAPCFRFASPDAVPSRPSPGDAVSMKMASLPSTSLEPAHRPVRRRLACHRLPCRRMHHCRRPSPSCPEPSRATSPGAASAPEAFPRCLAWRLLTPEPPPPPRVTPLDASATTSSLLPASVLSGERTETNETNGEERKR